MRRIRNPTFNSWCSRREYCFSMLCLYFQRNYAIQISLHLKRNGGRSVNESIIRTEDDREFSSTPWWDFNTFSALRNSGRSFASRKLESLHSFPPAFARLTFFLRSARPIYLLLCLSKVKQIIVLERLKDFTAINSLLPDKAFGAGTVTVIIFVLLSRVSPTAWIESGSRYCFLRHTADVQPSLERRINWKMNLNPLFVLLHQGNPFIPLWDNKELSGAWSIAAGVSQGSWYYPIIFNPFYSDMTALYVDDIALTHPDGLLSRALTPSRGRHCSPNADSNWLTQNRNSYSSPQKRHSIGNLRSTAEGLPENHQSSTKRVVLVQTYSKLLLEVNWPTLSTSGDMYPPHDSDDSKKNL